MDFSRPSKILSLFYLIAVKNAITYISIRKTRTIEDEMPNTKKSDYILDIVSLDTVVKPYGTNQSTEGSLRTNNPFVPSNVSCNVLEVSIATCKRVYSPAVRDPALLSNTL